MSKPPKGEKKQTPPLATVEPQRVVGTPVADPALLATETTIEESWAGPLPPPAALTAFNEALPGLAREVVDAWKGETAHRHDIDKRAVKMDEKLVDAEVFTRYAVVVVLGLLALTLVVGFVVALLLGQQVAAGILGVIATIASILAGITRFRGRNQPPPSASAPSDRPRR